jgi:hypothetical protein
MIDNRVDYHQLCDVIATQILQLRTSGLSCLGCSDAESGTSRSESDQNLVDRSKSNFHLVMSVVIFLAPPSGSDRSPTDHVRRKSGLFFNQPADQMKEQGYPPDSYTSCEAGSVGLGSKPLGDTSSAKV